MIMRQPIRFYKRFDADLLCLLQKGVPLTRYLTKVLAAFAKGEDCTLHAPFSKTMDLKNCKSTRRICIIRDEASIEVLQSVQEGYRCSFCKMLLRQALSRQQLGVFFKNGPLVDRENTKVQDLARKGGGIRMKESLKDVEPKQAHVKTTVIKQKKDKNLKPDQTQQKQQTRAQRTEQPVEQPIDKKMETLSEADVVMSMQRTEDEKKLKSMFEDIMHSGMQQVEWS